jgi:hypothetical protein
MYLRYFGKPLGTPLGTLIGNLGTLLQKHGSMT